MRLSADGRRSGPDVAGSAAILASALGDESGRRCSTFPNPGETGWDADLQTSRRAASKLSRTARGEAAKQDSRRTDEQKAEKTEKLDRKYRSRVLTSVIQEALCSSVSLKACRVMQVLLGLMSPRLWKSVLTLNLSCPLSSLSLSTCSESREADRRGDGGRTGSDISCGKTKEGQASSYFIFIDS